jgi:glycosyltransferase involved in cell wall biosynthesis
MPTLSVLMSVYNGSTYLQEAIDSILSQTFTDFEFLIIDDCSTDNSWQILQEYADRDGRIRLLQNQENLGLTQSLNRGLAVAEGKYIARQDADDVALPDRFQKQVQVLEQQPDVVLVSCEMEWIDAAKQSLGSMKRTCRAELVPWLLLFYNHVEGHSQVLYRRQTALTAGGYDEARRYSQDYDLWSRLVKQGKIVILPEFLQFQRIHSQAISAQKKAEQEALSLTQTQKNIAALIGEALSEDELRALRGFWMVPVYWYYFGNVVLSREKAAMIQTRLRQLYQAFVQQDALSSDSLKREIKQLICRRYGDWLQHLGFRKHFMLKLQIFIYGLAWLPR